MSRLFNASVVLCSLLYNANAWGQHDASDIRHVRVLETDDYYDVDVVDLGGVVFPPRANSILVLDQPTRDAATLVLVPPDGLPGNPGSLSLEISDPINITFDGRARRLFLFEPDSNELVAIKLRDGDPGPDIIQRFQATEFGVEDPNGIAVDPKTGTLFILDRVGPKIVQVDPGPRKNYEGAAALKEGRISRLFLSQTVGNELRGLGFSRADGGLYVFSPARQALYQITRNGRLVHVGDFSGSRQIDPKGFVFVRSLDQTDNPSWMNLYIASGGGPSGQVSEWSLRPLVQRRAQKK